MSRMSRGSSGSPRFAPAPVSMRGASNSPSGRSLNKLLRFIPSCSRSSSEFLRSLSRPPIPFGSGPYCQGLVPLRGSTGCVHFTRGFPSPRYVPSAGALNLSTAFSAHRLHGLVSSRSRVQGVSLVQGNAFSPQRSCPLRNDLPPCRCSMAARQDES
jgi:hypothetical protein